MEIIRGAFASGSGPNAERERNGAYHIMYAVIRQRIEALPETVSREDVLKAVDECRPEKSEDMGNWPLPQPERTMTGPSPIAQILSNMEVDSRVSRLVEISANSARPPSEQQEWLNILETLIEEAKAESN
jgi:hypothetical protein